MRRILSLISVLAMAACSSAPTPTNTAAVASQDIYTPGLGEYMSAIQVHHEKLWFAGSKSNWPLAGYELGEIKETLDDAAYYQPNFKGIPVAKMIGPMTDDAIKAIDQAIAQKDKAAFGRAFDRLSAACSACHQQANHPFIRIKRPTAPTLTNQDYAPH